MWRLEKSCGAAEEDLYTGLETSRNLLMVRTAEVLAGICFLPTGKEIKKRSKLIFVKGSAWDGPFFITGKRGRVGVSVPNSFHQKKTRLSYCFPGSFSSLGCGSESLLFPWSSVAS